MREFNLEEAKSGKEVCTRDGKEARVICYDARKQENTTSIIALVDNGYYEELFAFSNNGRFFLKTDSKSSFDLMMKI